VFKFNCRVIPDVETCISCLLTEPIIVRHLHHANLVNLVPEKGCVNLWNNRRVEEILKPRTDFAGVPSGFLEVGNRIYLDILPNYSSTNGIQIFFGREQRVFTIPSTYTDTTTEPGIPLPFHELLAQYTAYDLVSTSRPDDVAALRIFEKNIKRIEQDLKNFIDARNPTKVRLQMRRVRHIFRRL